MKKRITSLLLALALVCALLPAALLTASAETYSGACGNNLTWALDTETGVMEISGTGDMIMNNTPWYSYKESIRSVVIGEGVTSIGPQAFRDCTNLTDITLPGSLEDIGAFAFHSCTSLTSVTIPDGVKSIGDTAFNGCTALNSINIPDSVTSIGSFVLFDTAYYNDASHWSDDVFYAGNHLIEAKDTISGEYVIREGTKTIASSAFDDCSFLTGITIPDSITIIGTGAFSGCVGLTEIKLPNSITSIGKYAFGGCTGLKGIVIPENVTSISNDTFNGCKALEDVTIPDSVTSIGINAFCFSGLTSVTIPDSVTSIGQYAFSYCTKMTCITIANSVTNIDVKAFACCDRLTDVYYSGTKNAWDAISIGDGNECLRLATIHYGNKPITPSTGFTDVPQDAWYADAVKYAVSGNLMNGTGNGKFSPDDSMTRAMLVTVLWRYEGAPVEGTNSFTDVPAGKWYTDAVAWAAANGIVGGVGNNKFDPNGNITREQMAAILYRYAQKKGFDTNKHGSLDGFPDHAKISGYAKDAIAWTVGEGIINGMDGKLQPQGNATRAQVATILMRFIENIAK